MLKLLHSADWHLGKRLQEYSRLPEQQLVLEEMISIADREEVDLVLLAGDIFDSFNPSHEAVELLYKSLRRLSKDGKRPIIAISGNHDSTQFISAPDPLARELGILFYSRYDQEIATGTLDSGLQITRSAPGFVELKLPQYNFPVRIILAPYANEVLLKTYLGEEDKEAALREVLGKKWQNLADNYCDDTGVNLFMGHFFFMKEGKKPEAEPESERPILHVGGTQALYTHLIPDSIQYAALGHLHRYHAVDSSPCPVVYSSSPLAYSFSEAGQEKKVVLVEAEPNKPVQYQPIALKEGRPLYQKAFSNLADTLAWLETNPYCFVEIIYETETSIDAETRKTIMKAHDGIVNLIPRLTGDLSLQNTGLQAEDLGKDMGMLFSRFYQSAKGVEPNEEINALFNEIISQNEPL
ncbi:exonuclease sbcCD subunit D [Echinicola strongylocentroti]|uniref:Nuclease SbcCD subunit D n=1 Tax=Echinicola strongylocentroti TaxID=1795355 RepID=A0A2Z4IJT0_9BACT|nr:exonuclease subunit SbcD [Echinicola strongylocentroti]AWW31224.1 exonuclease sbcCD subunit D [Echinicola strongylocentroti]